MYQADLIMVAYCHVIETRTVKNMLIIRFVNAFPAGPAAVKFFMAVKF
jgi:hypothetical protein